MRDLRPALMREKSWGTPRGDSVSDTCPPPPSFPISCQLSHLAQCTPPAEKFASRGRSVARIFAACAPVANPSGMLLRHEARWKCGAWRR